jgi:hypothetical protein
VFFVAAAALALVAPAVAGAIAHPLGVLLVWLRWPVAALLLGAQVDALLEHMSAEGKRRSARSLSYTASDRPP